MTWRRGHRPPTEEERERRLLAEQERAERERQERLTQRHISAQGVKIIRQAEQAKRKAATDAANEHLQQMTLDALAQEDAAIAASAPAGANDRDWIEARKVLMRVEDLKAQTGKVGFGVTDQGKAVAVLEPKQQKSEGLFRRYVADVGQLVDKPVDTNRLAKVKLKE